MLILLKKFLLHPGNNPGFEKMTFFNFNFLFLINFITVILVVVLEYFVFGGFDNNFANNVEEINENIIFYMIFAVIFFPIWEEFLHRYYLDYKTTSLFISAILLLVYFFSGYDELNSLQNVIHFSCFLFLMVILLLKKIYGFINIKLLVWGSILFFGLFHLSNYESEIYINNYFIVPLLVMPQFIGGFFLAFIRFHYRFIHCILYHGFFNLVIFVIGFIGYKLFLI